MTPELETRQLEAVLRACGDEPVTLFACSCAGLASARFASAQPERVRKIVFFGGYATREDIPDATRRSIVDFARVNWQLAAQMLAGLLLPHGSGDEIAGLSRYQRHAASADVAAAFLELDLTSDARPFLPQLAMPTLVLHRRGDRTVPISRGRELASLLPNARFIALSGDSHLPWMDGPGALHRALAGFLEDSVPIASNGDSPLTRRETEVLRLVAVGLSNREIASSLVLSEHTVHRHVANILRKLTQSSRAAAATQAARAGLHLDTTSMTYEIKPIGVVRSPLRRQSRSAPTGRRRRSRCDDHHPPRGPRLRSTGSSPAPSSSCSRGCSGRRGTCSRCIHGTTSAVRSRACSRRGPAIGRTR